MKATRWVLFGLCVVLFSLSLTSCTLLLTCPGDDQEICFGGECYCGEPCTSNESCQLDQNCVGYASGVQGGVCIEFGVIVDEREDVRCVGEEACLEQRCNGDIDCPQDDRICTDGICVEGCRLDGGFIGEPCGGSCVRLTTDPQNCGECGLECAPGFSCINATCRCDGGAGECNESCASNDDCDAGQVCKVANDGRANTTCGPPNSAGGELGEACSTATQCASNLCAESVLGTICLTPCDSDQDCERAGFVCGSSDVDGATISACVVAESTPCSKDSDCPSDTHCAFVTKDGEVVSACMPTDRRENGADCTVDSDCSSLFCLDDLCAAPCDDNSQCTNRQSCRSTTIVKDEVFGTFDTCETAPFQACTSTDDCTDSGRVCGILNEATGPNCLFPNEPPAAELGAACQQNDECRDTLCLPASMECSVVCDKDTDCAADQMCTANSTPGDTFGFCVRSCASEACIVGAVRCQAEEVQTCIEDPVYTGCGMWDDARECFSEQEVCIEGACQVPSGCNDGDGDGDGYGVGCDLGPDCNDSDPDVYPGAPELCNGVDNDCNGSEDDGLGIGQPCEDGTGTCTSTGVTACNPDGTTYCDAPTPMGSPEVCDGQDNDCDGVPDNGDVCDACNSDPHEPNDALATAATLPISATTSGLACPNDTDFFELSNLQNNRQYRVAMASPQQMMTDLELVFYINGSAAQTVSIPGSDFEGIVFTADTANDYAIEVSNVGGGLGIYSLAMVRTSTLACTDEDAFTPNHSRNDAYLLVSDWRVSAYHCPGQPDYYRTIDVPAGSTLEVFLTDTPSSSGDLDLYIFEDPDGNGVYTQAAQSRGPSTFETISYSVTQETNFIIEVRDFNGTGDFYRLEWTY